MNLEELKKDFEVFSKGIGRLEQLKAGFRRINTLGHEKEAEEIRSMLNNVSAIPKLEVKIANLKYISSRNRSTQKYNYTNLSNVELKRILYIEKQIAELKDAIKYLSECNGSKLTKKDLKNMEAIPKNEKQKNGGKIRMYQRMLGVLDYFVPFLKSRIRGGKSRKFFKCHELLLKAEKALQNNNKSEAKKHYLKAKDVYLKLEYLEKKEIYNDLMNFCNNFNTSGGV